MKIRPAVPLLLSLSLLAGCAEQWYNPREP